MTTEHLDVLIRPARPEDLLQLCTIEALAAPKTSYTYSELRVLYSRYQNTFFVAESQQIDGYIIFSHDGHIISMVVAPERRRQGIGRQLIQRAVMYCAGKSLRLEVRVGNRIAQKFYQSEGFTLETRLRCYYGNGEDALIMVRPGTREGGRQKT